MKSLSLIMLYVLIVFCSSNLLGQNVKVELSPLQKLSNKKKVRGHLHSNETGHWIYFEQETQLKNIHRKSVFVEKYDNNLNLVFSKEYVVQSSDIRTFEVRFLKDQFVWFQIEANKIEDEVTLYVTQIDLEGKASKPIEIAKFDYEVFEKLSNFAWKVNHDKSKLLVLMEYDLRKLNKNNEAYIAVYDNEFNKLWSKEVNLPNKQSKIIAHSWRIVGNGDVYFLAKVFKEGKSNKHNFDMHGYKITEDYNKKFQLKIGNSYIKSMKIANNKFDDDGVFVAFIGDSRRGPIQGIEYVKIDGSTSNVKLTGKWNFTISEVEKFGKRYTYKDRKSRKRGLATSFYIKDIVFHKDGTFQAVSELYKETVSSSYSNDVKSVSTKFINNHIIVMDFDIDGQLTRTSIIPKKIEDTKPGRPERNRLYEETTEFMFYTLFKTDNQLYFIYNDNKRNFEESITNLDKYKPTAGLKHTKAVIAHIDENGELKRKQLFNGVEINSLLMPKHSKQINENQIFFFTRKQNGIAKDDFRIGVMTITE